MDKILKTEQQAIYQHKACNAVHTRDALRQAHARREIREIL